VDNGLIMQKNKLKSEKKLGFIGINQKKSGKRVTQIIRHQN
jgi:hypothetical protein